MKKKTPLFHFLLPYKKKKNSNYVFHAHVVGTKKISFVLQNEQKKKYFIGCLLEQGWPLP